MSLSDGYTEASQLALDLPGGFYTTYHDDAFAWLDRAESCSIEAVVTDPPYGLEEYEPDQLKKLRTGQGGIWRVPPTLDGRRRRPLPRFTVLSELVFKLTRACCSLQHEPTTPISI